PVQPNNHHHLGASPSVDLKLELQPYNTPKPNTPKYRQNGSTSRPLLPVLQEQGKNIITDRRNCSFRGRCVGLEVRSGPCNRLGKRTMIRTKTTGLDGNIDNSGC